MNIKRALGTSAATAVLVLAPTAAFADGYGGVTPPSGGGGAVGGPAAGTSGTSATTSGASTGSTSGSTSGLPSTGSSALDTVIGGAGLALLLGGGATLVAARRRQGATA